jgi:hypothetical protein
MQRTSVKSFVEQVNRLTIWPINILCNPHSSISVRHLPLSTGLVYYVDRPKSGLE